jgi:hypothetical protein
LLADGLDALDDAQRLRSVQQHYRELLAELTPTELRALLAHQEALLARRRAAGPPLPPLPPSMRPRKRKPRRGR